MANADFSQNKQTAPGGFDAGSYREKAKPEQAVTLTPRQQKLAALEAKLPAALSTRAAALALSVVVMLAAFFGFGSAKLRGKYNTFHLYFPDDREQVFELIEIIHDGDHIVDDGAARREDTGHIVQHPANVLKRLPCCGLAAAEQHPFVVPDGCILGGHLHPIIPHSILSFPWVVRYVPGQGPVGLSCKTAYHPPGTNRVRVWEDSKKHKDPGCFHSGPLCHFYFEE